MKKKIKRKEKEKKKKKKKKRKNISAVRVSEVRINMLENVCRELKDD